MEKALATTLSHYFVVTFGTLPSGQKKWLMFICHLLIPVYPNPLENCAPLKQCLGCGGISALNPSLRTSNAIE